MKVAIIGDPHFANRKVFGWPTKIKGRNARLQRVVDTFVWIGEEIYKRGDIDAIFVLGDITHDHGVLTPPVIRAVQEGLLSVAPYGIPLYIFSGNHDLDGYGESAVWAFQDPSSGTYVVDSNGRLTDVSWTLSAAADGPHFCVIPYHRHPKEVFQKITMTPIIALMHHHFDGAIHGTHEFQPPGGMKSSELPDNVLLAISGHYHKRQWVSERICYAGAPLQHDFGEADYVPGFTVFEAKDGDIIGDIEFIETPPEIAPRFHVLPHDIDRDKLPGLLATDYYRVDLPTDVDPATIADLKNICEHLVVKSITANIETRSRVEEYLGEQQDLEGAVELEDVVEAYVVLNEESEERQDELIELGKEIVQKVIGDES